MCSHEEVLQWVRQQGMSHEMTYQFILSVKETQLTDEAFSRAMAAGGPLFAEWRLIQHDDSRYPHAHALAFGNQPVQIKSEAFQSWWRAVRQALEREQANAQEMQQEAALEQARAAALQQGAGLEHDRCSRQAAAKQPGAAGSKPRAEAKRFRAGWCDTSGKLLTLASSWKQRAQNLRSNTPSPSKAGTWSCNKMQKIISNPYSQAWRRTRQQKQHRLDQGRLTANEAATRLPDSGETPLATLRVSHGTMPTVFTTADKRGHLLIVAPPDRPWRDQLTLTLTHWPGSALVVDPDGRLYQQTAAGRQKVYGPVYAIPGYRLGATNLLRLWRLEEARQLHQFLLPDAIPLTQTDEAVVANPTVALFCAVGCLPRPTSAIPFSCCWTWP
jgi:hypothetical protein